MPSPDPHEPSQFELGVLGVHGRIQRMMRDEGLTMDEAVAKLLQPETREDYLARNAAAMEDVEQHILSPDYMERFAVAQSEPDAAKRAELLAALKRDNFANHDIEALHRVIRARNRQLKAEGLLPPDAPI